MQCIICGSDEFQKISNQYRQDNKKLECAKCYSRERHRCIKVIYDRHIKKNAEKVLLLSKDPAKYYLPDHTEQSIFNSTNSIDLTDIQRNDETYDLIYCHHILEHIENDALAFYEMCRILKKNGQLCWTVPAPLILDKTVYKEDFEEFPNWWDPGHYRVYGRDNIIPLIKVWDAMTDVHTRYFIEQDTITGKQEMIFLTEKQ